MSSGAGGGQQRLDGVAGPRLGRRIVQQPVRVVVGQHHAVEVGGELVGVGVGAEVAFGDPGAEDLRDRVVEVAMVADELVA